MQSPSKIGPLFKLLVAISVALWGGVSCSHCSNSNSLNEAIATASPHQAGDLELIQSGKVSWTISTFSSSTEVRIQSYSSKESEEGFDSTVITEGPYGFRRTQKGFRIITGKFLPQAPLQVTLMFPAEIKNQLQSGRQLHVFVEFLSGSDLEVHDSFMGVEIQNQTENWVSFRLDPEAFSYERNSESLYEAIIYLATAKKSQTTK
jgi:hypothetical protein